MSDFADYLKKALDYAKENGISDKKRFLIVGVILSDEGNPDDVFYNVSGNATEALGCVELLHHFLKDKKESFMNEVIGVKPVEEKYTSSVGPSRNSFSDDDKSELSRLSKKLLDSKISGEEREQIRNQIKEIMRKTISGKKPKTTPEQESQIRDFMEKFGKNFKPGDDFNESDLLNLI